MPPKTTPAKKPAAKSTTGAKPAPKAAGKPAAKPAAKTTAKPAAKAPAKAEAAAPAPAPAPLQPIVYAEYGLKELDAKVISDKEGTVKATGKWPTVFDEAGVSARFLRHRDVNMLTVPDAEQMEPETIRKAVIGSLKFGKPFILDMMEAEMYEFCKDQFDKILPGLLEMILDKSICDDTYRYMKIVKEEDGSDYQNEFNYNVAGFSFVVISQTAPNEELLRKTYPVKIV